MMRSLYWKEFREQRQIAILLPAMTAMIIFLAKPVAMLFEFPFRDSDLIAFQQSVLIMFALGCGLVTGAQHWAAEKEAGTLTLLDLQPVWRRRLWIAKTGYAIVQWLFQMAFILLIGFAVAAIPGHQYFTSIEPAVFIVGWSFLALCLSILASSRSKTVLTAIGWSLAATLVLPWFLGLLIQILFAASNVIRLQFLTNYVFLRFALSLILLLIFPLAPLFISFRTITERDRLRRYSEQSIEVSQRFSAFRTGWHLAWVDARSLLVPFAVCLVVNTIIVSSEAVMLWLLCGGLMGVAAGVSVTQEEQNLKCYKLWADQRLPVRTLWFAKFLNRLMLITFATLIAILIKTVSFYFYGRQLNAGLTLSSHISMINQPFTLVAFSPLVGFAIGMLFGLIAERKIIALIASTGTLLIAILFWLPLIGSGGLLLWQWSVLPIIFLLPVLWSLWPWATGRLNTIKRVVCMISVFLLVSFYWLTVEISRVVSVPALGSPFDIAEFRNRTRSLESNLAKIRLSTLADEITALQGEHFYHAVTPEMFAKGQNFIRERMHPTEFQKQYEIAIKQGWVEASPEFQKIAIKFLSAKWPDHFKQWSDVEEVDWLDLSRPVSWGEIGDLQQKRSAIGFAGQLFLLDAIRSENTNKPDYGLNRFRQVLHLSRLMNRRITGKVIGVNLERETLQVIHHWASLLKESNSAPDLKKLVSILEEHQKKRPTLEERFQTSYIMESNEIVDFRFGWDLNSRSQNQPQAELPWDEFFQGMWFTAVDIYPERERRKSILNLFAAGLQKATQADYPTLYHFDASNVIQANPSYYQNRAFPSSLFIQDWISPLDENPTPDENLNTWIRVADYLNNNLLLYLNMQNMRIFPRSDFQNQTILEMIKVSVALRGYYLEHQEFPESLKVLQSEWFVNVPENPLTQQPFVYETDGPVVILRAPDPLIKNADMKWIPEKQDFPKWNQKKILSLRISGS